MHFVALAVHQAINAQLLTLCRHALGVLAIDGNKLCEVDPPSRQPFGELQAQARRDRFRLRLIVGHSEATLRAQLLICRANQPVVGQCKACFQRVDGGAPIGAPLQRGAKNGERVRFLLDILRALVGQIGRT